MLVVNNKGLSAIVIRFSFDFKMNSILADIVDIIQIL